MTNIRYVLRLLAFSTLSTFYIMEQVKVTPGDSLMTTCTYDTTERTNVTLGGFGFTEEMWELRVLMWRTSLRIASDHFLPILSVFVTRCVSRQRFKNKNVVILLTLTTSQVCKLRALLSASRSGTVQELGGREGARLLLPWSASWGRAGAAPRSQCVPAVSGGALHHCQCPQHLCICQQVRWTPKRSKELEEFYLQAPVVELAQLFQILGLSSLFRIVHPYHSHWYLRKIPLLHCLPDHLSFTNIKSSLEKLAQLCGAGVPLSGAGKQKRMKYLTMQIKR